MKFDTTIYIKDEFLARLEKAGEATGQSKSELAVILLKRMMIDCNESVNIGRQVQYQVSETESWNRLHIFLKLSEYEYFIDMRKFFKKSVSLLLAMSIDKYLEEIIFSILAKTLYWLHPSDNYLLNLCENSKRMVKWEIFWGFLEEIHKT